MRTIRLTHDYPYSAREVWEVAIDYDYLAEAMDGLVRFEGLPNGKVQASQSMTVMVSLFGKLPAQPYHMEVVDFDDDAMRLVSSEWGAGVKSWQHTLQVTSTQTGCTLSDTIQIDAGWFTRPFSVWAKFLYKHRHKPRMEILDRTCHTSSAAQND
ncbi:SRPBCC family protein [Aliiroseovarius sp. 2305UL8-7]|uniref:SRPBCC family protein n=1 Tax=Aliiroseovarius conchicola TaxID=3121637 RepID=UPI003529514B